METLKNFFTGIFVIILSLIILGIILVFWPLFIGISSILLSILAGILFIVLIFYIIVLVGYLTRALLKKRDT